MKTCLDGGYSSVAERQTVALDVVGSTPTTHPKIPSDCSERLGFTTRFTRAKLKESPNLERLSRLTQSEQKAQLRWYLLFCFRKKTGLDESVACAYAIITPRGNHVVQGTDSLN